MKLSRISKILLLFSMLVLVPGRSFAMWPEQVIYAFSDERLCTQWFQAEYKNEKGIVEQVIALQMNLAPDENPDPHMCTPRCILVPIPAKDGTVSIVDSGKTNPRYLTEMSYLIHQESHSIKRTPCDPVLLPASELSKKFKELGLPEIKRLKKHSDWTFLILPIKQGQLSPEMGLSPVIVRFQPRNPGKYYIPTAPDLSFYGQQNLKLTCIFPAEEGAGKKTRFSKISNPSLQKLLPDRIEGTYIRSHAGLSEFYDLLVDPPTIQAFNPKCIITNTSSSTHTVAGNFKDVFMSGNVKSVQVNARVEKLSDLMGPPSEIKFKFLVGPNKFDDFDSRSNKPIPKNKPPDKSNDGS